MALIWPSSQALVLTAKLLPKYELKAHLLQSKDQLFIFYPCSLLIWAPLFYGTRIIPEVSFGFLCFPNLTKLLELPSAVGQLPRAYPCKNLMTQAQLLGLAFPDANICQDCFQVPAVRLTTIFSVPFHSAIMWT